jgi:hypothetical protein
MRSSELKALKKRVGFDAWPLNGKLIAGFAPQTPSEHRLERKTLLPGTGEVAARRYVFRHRTTHQLLEVVVFVGSGGHAAAEALLAYVADTERPLALGAESSSPAFGDVIVYATGRPTPNEFHFVRGNVAVSIFGVGEGGALARSLDALLTKARTLESLTGGPVIRRFAAEPASVRPGDRADLRVEIQGGERPYDEELSAEGGSVNRDPDGSWYFRAGSVLGSAAVGLRVVDARNLLATARTSIAIKGA